MFKSIDGGDSWKELTRNPGLPAGDWGRVGLANSKTMPNRISALIDSKEDNGLYQSEDGGQTWNRIADNVDITQRPFYYHHLHARPHNGDELWVLSNKLWQSLDGGKSWTQRSGTKDDFQDMAFDPKDPDWELAKQAAKFSGALLPTGKNLSEIANEPAKLSSKLQTVHWMLWHSEGRPPQSAYDVVDTLEKEIDAEFAAWNEFKNAAGDRK